MSINIALLDEYAKRRPAELLAEAQRDRLADQARGPARPFRIRLASWLYATAARVEGDSSTARRSVHGPQPA